MSGEIGKGLPGCHFGPSESSFVVNVRGGEGRVRKRGWLGNCVLKRCSKLFFTYATFFRNFCREGAKSRQDYNFVFHLYNAATVEDSSPGIPCSTLCLRY